MKKFPWAVLAVILACSMMRAQAETIVALTADKKLRHFSSTAPGAWTKTVQITGIPAARSMVGMDFRPDGSLVVLAHEGTSLYSYDVNPETGAAVQARTVQGGIAAGGAVGFDTFARGVRVFDLAMALNDPDIMVRYWFSGETWDSAGAVFLQYKPGPGGGSPDVSMVAMAASNSFPQAQASVLYGIDSLANTLVKIEWETGRIEKVAPLTNQVNAILPAGVRTGFDISGVTGIAYLSIPSAGGATALHTVDLTTGKTKKVGTIGPGSPAPGEVVMDISAAPPTQLVNLSTRSRVGTGEDVMIAGFIAQGRAPTRLLIRGLGPSLSGSGVVGPLEDPVLTIFDRNGVEVASNDNWKTAQETEIRGTGVAPKSELEAAYVGTFAPGAYTAKVSGKGGGTGVGLVEIYRLGDE